MFSDSAAYSPNLKKTMSETLRRFIRLMICPLYSPDVTPKRLNQCLGGSLPVGAGAVRVTDGEDQTVPEIEAPLRIFFFPECSKNAWILGWGDEDDPNKSRQ